MYKCKPQGAVKGRPLLRLLSEESPMVDREGIIFCGGLFVSFMIGSCYTMGE